MKSERIIIIILLLILAFSSGAQWSKAQEGTPPPPVDESEAGDETESSEITPFIDIPELAPAEPQDTIVMNIPIQGRATDEDGNPLNGAYTVLFTLWSANIGGTDICHDTDTVTFTNGFFTSMLNSCTAADFDGQGLWLGIKIGTDDEMTPRQAIGVVPYAASLRPFSDIRGDTTYLFIPGSAAVKDKTTDLTVLDTVNAAVRVTSGAAGNNTRYIRFPITIPAVLYGVNVRITSMRVYYVCDNGTNGYITATYLYKNVDAEAAYSLVSNTVDLNSNTATSYAFTTNETYNTLSADTGMISAYMALQFLNETDYVQISGIRLTIVTSY